MAARRRLGRRLIGGRAAAANAGFRPYLQIDPAALPDLFDAIGEVVATRDRRSDALLNRLRGRVFRGLARACGSRFNDLGSGVRLLRREVTRTITLYGEQHRFLPVLAESRGAKVVQLTLPQHSNDRRLRSENPSVMVERLLDLGVLYFLLRFTRKPFRFFGTLGLILGLLGVLTGLIVTFQKIAYGTPVADRPALLLSVLLVVVGVQITAVGLIGEIVVFTRAKDSDDLLIETIVRRRTDPARPAPTATRKT